MRKVIVISVCSILIFSGCGTYSGEGAYMGATLGSILGSAIGGISGGPRGSDFGTVIGMAGGAAIGGAIGAKADQKADEEVHEHYERVQQRKAREQGYTYKDDMYGGMKTPEDESGFDATNSGDDRIYDFNGNDYTGNYSATEPTVNLPASSSVDELAANYRFNPMIEIRNARFVDDNQDGNLNRGEICKVIFEIVNCSDKPLLDIQPLVVEASGNKNIYISPSIHVENILPGDKIRYTAMVKAGKRLKDGNARFCLSVLQGDKAISKVTEFDIRTVKKVQQ